MRCTQIIGLTKEAKRFLEENCVRVPKETCPTCDHKTGGHLKHVVYDRHDGMFEDEIHPLEEYYLKDGRIVRKIIQAAPWSSGPCYFYCLELEDATKVGEWPQEEIDNA